MVTRRSLLRTGAALYGLSQMEGLASAFALSGRTYHVSFHGDDRNTGSPTSMLRTIAAAAAKAQPGDTVTVHAGVYRERVSPPRGGTSAAQPIVYQAAPGEQVTITGAEVQKGWTHDKGDVWSVSIPNSFFGAFNPYSDVIHGDWFDGKGRQHHTGAVYVRGHWLIEAAELESVYKPQGHVALWFANVTERTTTLWAQFQGLDPNEVDVTINVRQTVFYPDKPGINYITVRGFTLTQAATPWAPPTAEQVGLIGTHWSKGWIIENNRVSYSACSGISLGKYGDRYDNLSANTAEGYVETIERATAFGWSRETIGHHLVRGNVVSHCEQAGIVGSLGPVFSTVTGNEIHDVHVRQLFTGAEMGAIKFHAAIDMEISNNYIHHNSRGIWLDWMAQGTTVSGNLCHDNSGDDGMVEVDHGPFLFANNVFLSATSQLIWSQGGAYVHNILGGLISVKQHDDWNRRTPYMRPHSCIVAGLHDNEAGDTRFINNIFLQRGDLSEYDTSVLPMHLDGNVFLANAKSCSQERDPLEQKYFAAGVDIENVQGTPHLTLKLDRTWAEARARHLVTTATLGNAIIPNAPFQRPDGSPIRIDTDYAGKARDVTNPFPGPFEVTSSGILSIPVNGAATQI